MRAVQLDLFSHIGAVYAEAPDGLLDNNSLYAQVAERAGIDAAELENKVPVGRAGEGYSLLKRKIRWYQQSLKQMGVIERVEGERGLWQLAEKTKKGLHKAIEGVKLVAFSTDLGVALWARNDSVFRPLGEAIHLYFSSPPYPLRNERAYGNVDQTRYVDFLCKALEPIVHDLVPGGSIVLNLQIL